MIRILVKYNITKNIDLDEDISERRTGLTHRLIKLLGEASSLSPVTGSGISALTDSGRRMSVSTKETRSVSVVGPRI